MDDLDPEAQRRIASFIRGMEALLHPDRWRDEPKPKPREGPFHGDLLELRAPPPVDPDDPGQAAWTQYEVVVGATALIEALQQWLRGDPKPIKHWLGFPSGPVGRPTRSTQAKALEVIKWRQLHDQGLSLEAAAATLGRDQRTLARWFSDNRVRELADIVMAMTARLDGATKEP